MLSMSKTIFSIIGKISRFTYRYIWRIEVYKVARLHTFTGFFKISMTNFYFRDSPELNRNQKTKGR